MREDEVSYGASNLGGWSQNISGRSLKFLLRVRIFDNVCGSFITAASILSRELTIYCLVRCTEIILVFEKGIWRVKIWTNISCRLHIYNELVKKLHAITSGKEYMENSWAPLISSWQKLKRWEAAYIVWTPQTLGWNCNCADIICLYCCLRKQCFLRPIKSASYISWWNFAANIQFWHCTLLGCVLMLANVSFQELEHNQREMTKLPIFEQWDTIDNSRERNIQFRYSFRQHQTCQLQPKTFILPILWVQ